MIEKILIWCGTILAIMLLIPTLVIFLGGFYRPALLESIQTKSVQGIEVQPIETYKENEVIEVLASIISPSTNFEAIKAQAVIVRTYLRRRELGIVEEGDLTRLSEEEMKSLWKNDFDAIYSIYEQAVEETKGEIMYYNEEPIEPVYHKESAGYTRDGMSLYNMDIPYLKTVQSNYDTTMSDKVILKTEVIERLENAYPEVLVDKNYIENQMQIVSRDEGGYIQSLQISNILLSGETFRSLMGLNSAAFTVSGQGDTLIFRTLGIGHGVGLSQNGANQMASAGEDYEAILKHYYTGITIHK